MKKTQRQQELAIKKRKALLQQSTTTQQDDVFFDCLDKLPTPEVIDFSATSLLQLLPTIPQALKLYNIYSLAGTALTSTVTAGLVADKMLQLYGYSRNICGLAGLFIPIAYASQQAIWESDKFDEPTKYLFLSDIWSATTLLTLYGPDIFTSDFDIQETLKSVNVVSELFDTSGSIADLKTSWN